MYYMKYFKIYILALAALFTASCDQFSDVSSVGKVEYISSSLKIKASVPAGVTPPSSYLVKFNNYAESYFFELTTDENGYLDVKDRIIPGIYTVTVSAEVNTNNFTYNFNGNLVNVDILENNTQLEVEVQAAKSGNLVLKELYYCGSRTPKKGTYFRDQYYEIYNNSEVVQYADNLCIGTMMPLTATANLPVWPGDDADKYVYFAAIWQIQGSGKDYPIQPGESILISQMADNHQVENLNPTSPVNLISSEFETYVKSTSIIKDNPAINMEWVFYQNKTAQWLASVFGCAYAIFYPDGTIDREDYISPVGQSTKAYKIDIDLIVDAVELVHDETKMKLKRVPAILDAGATTVGATYCSKSVSRKIKETKSDGRHIYMDTNNSSEDFVLNETPVLRRNGAKIPSWNTWWNLDPTINN